MNKYICGKKFEVERIEEAMSEAVSPSGLRQIMMEDTIVCMNTNVFDANIASVCIFIVVMLAMGLGILLGRHRG